MSLVFDDAGFRDVLRQLAPAVAGAGEQVAGAARSKLPAGVGVDVIHKTDRNGRPVALVTITHASGMARQANDGVLTRAAAECGLDVHRY